LNQADFVCTLKETAATVREGFNKAAVVLLRTIFCECEPALVSFFQHRLMHEVLLESDVFSLLRHDVAYERSLV
jgi:hypothetical protein